MLQEMVNQDPNDDFTRYGLALEYRKLRRADDALREFDRLIRIHPDYVPAYFMSGQYLAELNRTDEAEQRLQAGIAVAQKVGDSHAAMEMQEFLESLES